MKLSEVASALNVVRSEGDLSVPISGLAYDSRDVEIGDLFFAVPGFKVDGLDFAEAATQRGAAAVIDQRWLDDLSVPQICVEDVRRAMAIAAAKFYRNPSTELTTLGVTGTNGKTTTTYLVDQVLNAAGWSTSIFGGIEYRTPDKTISSKRTTPEAIDLQRMLRKAVTAGADVATMEISSHGIELARVDCLQFDVAVFTNLSRDHLDLHGDMDAYFAVKELIFSTGLEHGCYDEDKLTISPRGIINIDDPYGKRLAESSAGAVCYGLSPEADVRATDIEYSGWRTQFTLESPVGRSRIDMGLPGRFNLYNALAAAGASIALEVQLEYISAGLSSARGAPGRFQRVETDTPYQIIIDYAHNEDGLRRVLETARHITTGKLITVFGCPGERDVEKRPGMGRIAGELSDMSILTTDDCYQEPASQILAAVETGLEKSGKEYLVVEDRRLAIETAISAAKSGDTVFIAGKGHEQYQIMADGPRPFSDIEVILETVPKP